MTTQQISDKLVELCKTGEFETAQKELFSNDAVSIETFASPAFEKETKGLDAIIEKGKKFMSMVEESHSMSISEPVVAGSSFALLLKMDVTMKERGRQEMAEICVYDVKDGKIVSESFHM